MCMGLLTYKFTITHSSVVALTSMSQAHEYIMLYLNGTISGKCSNVYHSHIHTVATYISACSPCIHIQATCLYTKSHMYVV